MKYLEHIWSNVIITADVGQWLKASKIQSSSTFQNRNQANLAYELKKYHNYAQFS